MSFGIQLNVDARQVKEAQQSVSQLGDLLRGLSSNNVSIGGNNKAELELLRQANLDTTRLGSVARAGETKGGVLNPQQWKDAAETSKRIGDNIGKWVAHTTAMQTAIARLKTDIKSLNESWLNPDLPTSQKDTISRKVTELENKKSELEKELRSRSVHDARMGHIRDRAAGFQSSIDSFGSPQSGGGGGMASMLGGISKYLGGALAIAGGFSIGSLIAQAVGKYKELEPLHADLRNMGLNRPGVSRYGYMQSETAQLEMQLGRGTGLTGGANMRLATSLQGMARARNIDPNMLADFASGIYKTSGAGEGPLKGLTAWIHANTKEQIRQTDVLKGILGLQQSQFAQQGATVSDRQTAFLASMFTRNFDKGMTLQNTDAYQKVNAGLGAGGQNPGEQLLFWKWAGGDKFGGAWKDLVKMKRTMAEGLTNDTLRKNMTDDLLSGDQDKAQMRLHTMFGLGVGKDSQSEAFLGVLKRTQGMSTDDVVAESNKMGLNTSKLFPSYKSNVRSTEAGMESSQMKSGSVLAPEVLKFQKSITDLGAKFVKAASELTSIFSKGGIGAVLESGLKFSKEAIKSLWDGGESGVFGKMLLILGTIAAGTTVMSVLMGLQNPKNMVIAGSMAKAALVIGAGYAGYKTGGAINKTLGIPDTALYDTTHNRSKQDWAVQNLIGQMLDKMMGVDRPVHVTLKTNAGPKSSHR